jgi:hypothetical protein
MSSPFLGLFFIFVFLNKRFDPTIFGTMVRS